MQVLSDWKVSGIQTDILDLLSNIYSILGMFSVHFHCSLFIHFSHVSFDHRNIVKLFECTMAGTIKIASS